MHSINYQVERWRRQDWSKATRYYSCELRQNLFGQWVVLRRWGRVSALKGQTLEQYCSSYDEGLRIFFEIEKRRVQRGYSAV